MSSRIPIATQYSPDGVLKPWKESDVACSESGLISKFFVRRGDSVKMGTRLAQLESSIVELQIAVARAQAEGKGRIAAAKAEVMLNDRKVQAFASARRSEFASQLELERAEADLQIAQARLLVEMEDQQLLQIQLQQLERQLQQRTITAPFDGIIVELKKEVGEYVAPVSPDVLRIVDVSRLRASFFLQPFEVKLLKRGTPVNVKLGDGYKTKAEIESIAPVADSESGLIEISILLDNPGLGVIGSRCTLLLDEPAANET